VIVDSAQDQLDLGPLSTSSKSDGSLGVVGVLGASSPLRCYVQLTRVRLDWVLTQDKLSFAYI
jgi:hypothetical protein